MNAKKITIDISDRYPVLIDMEPSAFGKIFAGMNDGDQVTVLHEMVEAMRPHQRQWDFISIELEKPENRELRDVLRNVLVPGLAVNAEMLSALKEAVAFHDDEDNEIISGWRAAIAKAEG